MCDTPKVLCTAESMQIPAKKTRSGAVLETFMKSMHLGFRKRAFIYGCYNYIRSSMFLQKLRCCLNCFKSFFNS